MTLWLALAAILHHRLDGFRHVWPRSDPGSRAVIAELAYGFVYKMVEDVTGKDGIKYFPYIFTLFIFILFSNFLALIPMSFSPTSHICGYGNLRLWRVLCCYSHRLHQERR